MKKRDVLILDARRTAVGKYGGVFKNFSAPNLLAPVLSSIIAGNSISSEYIDEVIAGHVLASGAGQNPARQAVFRAGLGEHVPAVTVQKVCASSLIALREAAYTIWAGEAECVIAAGMESMSQAPFLARRAFYMQDGKKQVMAETSSLIDSMVHDGLKDANDPPYCHMGNLADECAAVYRISREKQDEFALLSHERARNARELPDFRRQIVPLRGVVEDEGVRVSTIESLAQLHPFFTPEGGTVTAGNSSQISDGAAALLLASRARARFLGLKPLARIVAFATFSQSSSWYTTAPVGAIEKILRKVGLAVGEIDLFEINEAFAVVVLNAMESLSLPILKVNVWGGAIAIGHPIGASGARIVVHLAHALRGRDGQYGLAVACNGGGEAVAVIIENLQRGVAHD